MSETCLGMLPDKTLCPNKAGKSGFCKSCDPTLQRKHRLALVEDAKKQAKKDRERAEKNEQKREIVEQVLSDMIEECQTIEDLRKLELKIMGAMIKEASPIDPRFGSALVQLMKHQEVLIDRRKGNADELNESARDRLERLARNMNPADALGFLGDIAHGMAKLVKAAKEETEDDALVIDVEVSNG